MEKFFPSGFIHGRRINLRRYELADAARVFAAIDADRIRLAAFLPWVDFLKKVSHEEEFIRNSAVNWLEGKGFDFAILRREDDHFLGSIGAHSISLPNERAELGYWVSGEGEGNGYVSDAVGLLEAELFRVGFHRLEIRCDETNARSAAVPKRCGYLHEGTLREDTLERGQRRNTMVWGKLRPGIR